LAAAGALLESAFWVEELGFGTMAALAAFTLWLLEYSSLKKRIRGRAGIR